MVATCDACAKGLLELVSFDYEAELIEAARVNPSQWDGICELVYQIVANDQPFKIPGVP